MVKNLPANAGDISEVAQSCPTLWDPMDCSLPCSSIHGILQARVLKWVAISFSRGSSQPRDWTWVVGRHFTIWATREVHSFPHSSVGKSESACNAGDPGLIPGSGRSPAEGSVYPLQYSGLENSMDCRVHGVSNSRTQLSNFHFQKPIKLGSLMPGDVSDTVSIPVSGRSWQHIPIFIPGESPWTEEPGEL